jgi:hypothetical protein
METEQVDGRPGSAPVRSVFSRRSAKLFAPGAQMLVILSCLGEDSVIATTAVPPAPGSIVVLSRNGIRISAAVAWVEGRSFSLELDAPLPERSREQLLGTRSTAYGRPASGHPKLLAA